ncbi:MAG: lysoplasmalogenase [Sphingobacteriales bacterium]|nr:MAG: lysoplasmalogenase [Sphingobacteriales bacterium]
MQKFKPFSILFLCVFIAQIFALITQNQPLVYVTKPLITITLLMGLIRSDQLYGKFRKRIAIGLIFAFFGDVFLMVDQFSPIFFKLGLFSFLGCHICYILAFNLDMRSAPKHRNKYFLISSIVLAIFTGGFFMYLRPGLGMLQIPVLLYCFVLAIMVMLSIGRWGKVSVTGARLMTVGALLFMFSDSFLAYCMFVVHVTNSHIVVMSTYMMAQYFIVLGTIYRTLTLSNEEVSLEG